MVVGALFALALCLVPADGIRIGGFNIKMPSFEELYSLKTEEYADISNLVAANTNFDSLPDITEIIDEKNVKVLDTFKVDAAVLAAQIHRLEFPKGDKAGLMAFFEKLKASSQGGKMVRIMHYGDSQIEGDRMTGFLRNKLQNKFGGSGPGLLPALQPYDSYLSLKQLNVGNWSRYSNFGKVDPLVKHKDFGPLMAYSRFAPLQNDSALNLSQTHEATVLFSESAQGYASVRSFQQVQLFYGRSHSDVQLKILSQGVEVATTILQSGTEMRHYQMVLPEASKQIQFQFTGNDSPDIYALSLDGTSGVAVDNIPMRGSSGTIFNRVNHSQLREIYSTLNVQLFILQFGGNVMPYLKDSAEAYSYGRWFYSQLMTLKKLRPEAYVIVVGPGDMSYKDGEDFVSYPFLELVRNELRNASLKAGFAFWDMYSAMGGHNSMPSWVNATPPLAGADYTHFTPNGAKLVSNMFYNALMIEMLP